MGCPACAAILNAEKAVISAAEDWYDFDRDKELMEAVRALRKARNSARPDAATPDARSSRASSPEQTEPTP